MVLGEPKSPPVLPWTDQIGSDLAADHRGLAKMRHLPPSRFAGPASRNGLWSLSSPGVPPFLADQETARRAILRFAPALPGAAPPPCRRSIRIAAAMVRSRRGKELKMIRIGTFKKVGGEYHGAIATLTIQAKAVCISPVAGANGNAPTHRVFVDGAEVGAAWTKKTQDDRPYLSVKLDDPGFTAPIFAQLFDNPTDEYDLVWGRQQRRRDS